MVDKKIKKQLTFIDLFSGAGGFSLGFQKQGFKNIFSIDIQKDFNETYRENFPDDILLEKDILKLSDKEILELTNGINVDVVVGGPPCQGFSIAGNIGRKFIDDPRNKLFKEFIRVVKVVEPKYFVMENVARLYTHNKNQTRKEIINDFEKLGYSVKCKILSSENYGVPQKRRRVIFIGSRDDELILFPKYSNNYRTVFDAINTLPSLKSGQKSDVSNHTAMNHTEQMLDKMNYIKDGCGRECIPENIRPISGDIRKYIKYDSKKPSITVTGDMRKVFHYSQNRALTVRELARLQTFPDEFIFKGNSISQQQQVGNAVPPVLAEHIAISIKEMVEIKNKDDVIYFKNKKYPKVNYIGNKEKLNEWIIGHFPEGTKSVFDAFSGGASISYEAKKRGYEVISNDILKINSFLAKSLIENSNEVLNSNDLKIIFSGKPFEGFMCKNYSEVLFFPDECMELDLYRKNIDNLSSEYKKSIAIALLRRSMIRKMPYSRFNLSWDAIKQLRDEEYSYKKYKRKRAYHNQSFKEHFLDNLTDYNNSIFDNGKTNTVFSEDIFKLLDKVTADVIYLDPPYTGTMNNYFGFYGVMDEYLQGKKLKPFKNNFMDKNKSLELFDKLFSNLSKYKYWILSYNNNSYPSKQELLKILSKYSDNVEVFEKKHIYKISGKESKDKNKEYLFVIENTNLNKK